MPTTLFTSSIAQLYLQVTFNEDYFIKSTCRITTGMVGYIFKLTFPTRSGDLKSTPPWSVNPQGLPPSNATWNWPSMPRSISRNTSQVNTVKATGRRFWQQALVCKLRQVFVQLMNSIVLRHLDNVWGFKNSEYLECTTGRLNLILSHRNLIPV